MKRGLCVAGFIIIAHLVSFCGITATVHNGVLDIRNHNWQKDGIVTVSGNWEFYWDKFYTPDSLKSSPSSDQRHFAFVPDFWNNYITTNNFGNTGFGYATYHVKILCPTSSSTLALKLLTIQGAYTLFVNGKKMIAVGKPATTKTNTIADLKPAVIKVQPENNILDIVLLVSNFNDRKGGLWDTVKLGTEDEIMADTIKNLSVAFIIAGVFLLAFLYNLILFLHFKKRYALIFFALLCLIIFIRILVTGEIPVDYLFNWNWEFIRRLEFISLYFSVPVMALFSFYLFPEDFSKKALYVILPVSSAFIITSLFCSYYVYTYFVWYYELFILLTAFYGLAVYIKAAAKKRQGSYLFLIGFIIVLATMINDVLYENLIIRTAPLFYAGLAFFALTLSIILARQFLQIFAEVEGANKQLAAANASLAVMNTDVREKNNELKKINQELDIFIHRTSHDLRAPLSSVKGIADLMEDETEPSILHEYAVLQKKTLQRMDNLIKDIIDFLKNKRLRLTLEEINFNEVINNTLEDLGHMKNASQIHTEVIVQQTKKFVSDVKRVNTIINNLVSNAIKYADLTKAEPSISINVLVMDDDADIEISDNGIGIEENQLEKMFTMFYRATTGGSGSGLGLYLIKETVEKLNGQIKIISKKGEGTKVKVSIPDKITESQIILSSPVV